MILMIIFCLQSQAILKRKPKKGLKFPFYYSPHPVHSPNKKDSIQHKCGINQSRKSFSQLKAARKAFQNSVVRQKYIFFAGRHTGNLESAFNLLGKMKSSSFLDSMFHQSKNLKTDEDIACGFNNHFVSTPNSIVCE